MKKQKIIFAAFILIGIWFLIQWFFARPEYLIFDWQAWRQADTQSIALNFLRNGMDLLKPQINWGGSGPGYVEAEFQLYPMLIAILMGLSSTAEW